MPFDSPVLTVLTPAASHALSTLSATAAECGTTIGAIPDLGLLVRAASEAVVAYTGRSWVRESVREVWRGNGQGVRALMLRRTPVVEVTAASVDGVALNLATEIELDAGPGLLYRLDLDDRISWGGRVVRVEYSGGYLPPGADDADMPAIVQRSVAKIVAGWYHGQGRDPRLRSQTIEDVGSKSWVDPTADDLGLPPGIAPLLDPLRWRRA